MNEQTPAQARAYGAGIGIFTLVGALAIGLGALLFAVGMMSERRYEAAGSGLMASAIAYGFAANAIWRK